MGGIYDEDAFFEAYARMDRSRYGLAMAGEWKQFQRLFPDLRGKTVLDLGCGYGWHCKYAAEQGAAYVLGIDKSEKMIAVAREKNAHKAVRYGICGIEDYDYPVLCYDLVLSNLALHYVEDLNAVYRSVLKTLKPGGVFLFNIEHPVFTAGVRQNWFCDEEGHALHWPVDNYYYPGERETIFLGQSVQKYHRTLEQILNGLLQSGFRIEAVEEARPSDEMRSLPGMEEEMRRPMMLLVRAGKPNSQA